MTVEARCITGRDEFAALAAEWDALAELEGTPFSRHAWFTALIEAFGEAAGLRVWTAWRGEELVAALPTVVRGRGTLAGLANVHTPFLRPLHRDRPSLDALAGAIFSSGYGEVEIDALPAADAGTAALAAVAQSTGRLLTREARHVSPIVETVGDPAEWRARKKSSWNAPLDRLTRKMKRDFEADFRMVVEPDDLATELERGFQLEASGWKAKAGTAILSRPDTTLFYRSIANAFAERGELRLSSITLDGELVAFDLCLLDRRRLYLVKTAYDEGRRPLAPGLVLRLAAVERCFESDIEVFDLLGGDSEYKRKFSTTERRHEALHAFRRRPVAAARYAYRRRLRPPLRRAYRRIRRRDR